MLSVTGGMYPTTPPERSDPRPGARRLRRMPHPSAPASGPEDAPQVRAFRPRIDPPLAPGFAKDPAGERFVEWLNATLAPAEREQYADLPESRPTLHIVGAPRSGTTLLYQVLAGALDVGYVDNLVATFWAAPVAGLRLSRKLGLEPPGSFGSEFGRTSAVAEPHEFGYFWNHHLAYPDLVQRGHEHEAAIDWDALRRVIVNMAEARGAAMVFKPMLLIWHMAAMVRAMPRTCFVWIHRDARDTALSLLRMRMALRGDIQGWASLRPAGIPDDADPWYQVAAQVLRLEATIAAAAAALGPEVVMDVHYDELCADPNGVVARVAALMGAHGPAPAVRVPDLQPFTPGPSTGLEEHVERLDDALTRARADLAAQGVAVRA